MSALFERVARRHDRYYLVGRIIRQDKLYVLYSRNFNNKKSSRYGMNTLNIEKWTRRLYFAAWAGVAFIVTVILNKFITTEASSGIDHMISGFVLLGVWFVGAIAIPWLAIKIFKFVISEKCGKQQH